MKEVLSLQALIEEYLKRDKVVLAQRKGYRTYPITGIELAEKVKKLRVFLKLNNINKGSKIIILGANSINYVVLYFACILSGIIVVPLDMLTDKNLLKKINQKVEAKALFTDKKIKLEGLKTYSLDNLNYIKNIEPINLPHEHLKHFDIVEIMYTSGSTGEPKGVILTHENLLSGINFAIRLVPIKIRLRMLNLLPLSHIFAQIYGLFFMMYFGHKIFYIDTNQPNKIVSFIKSKKIHGSIMVPGILESLKKYLEGKSTLASFGIQFRLIGVGGAPLDLELEKWFRKHGINVVQGYGMTETSSVVSSNSFLTPKIGSVGKISKDVEIKLSPDNEILVRGKNVTPGYYKDHEKTHQTFEKEWLKTGDIGEIIGNYLYIKERKKDVIITPSGLKVYSIDVEKVLNKTPGIKESCVLEKDKRVHAVLILNKKTDPNEIIKQANSRLLDHQKISSFSIWHEDTFPKTPTAKIKKYLVLEQISRHKAPAYKYEDRLYEIISSVLKPGQKINSKDKLYDLGMDSLRRVELITELENVLGVEIEETALNQYTKVADLNKIMKTPVKEIKLKTWPLTLPIRIIRKISQKIIWYPIMRIFTKTEYSGLENLKNLKLPVIVASNHQSAWDPAIVSKKFPFKFAIAAHPEVVFGIGTKNPLKRSWKKFYGFLSTLFYNTYPFGESIGTDKSLEFTGEMLDRGYSIGIAPEGTRTLDGKIHAFKPGIGYLALNMSVPIVPARIEGMFYVLPRGKIIPRFGKSTVKFGKPIMPKEIENLSYIQATKLIEKRVKDL